MKDRYFQASRVLFKYDGIAQVLTIPTVTLLPFPGSTIFGADFDA
jgi:hypothetical protein